MTKPLYSIVIPFYNNRLIIAECFSSVYNLMEKYDSITEIIAIDDCSSDGTGEWLKKNYPKVNVVTNTTNLGFGKTCNRAVGIASNEWVILLNSDIKITSEIIPCLDELISSEQDLFQVGFYSFKESGEKFEGRKFIMPKSGLFKTRNNFSDYIIGTHYDSFYACGGHCLLSKSKFQLLHGFSSVYEPFYWEDVDLSYRGLKRGWKVLFDPRCTIIHCHRGSIRSSNSQRKIEIIQTRNKIIFFWKNVSSPMLWCRHLSGLIFRILTSWIAGDFVFYRALIKAIPKVPDIIKEAGFEAKFRCKSDFTLFLTGK